MAVLKLLVAALLGRASCSSIPWGTGDTETISKRATSFWYANMDHTGPSRGYAPDLGNDYSYPVYIAVNPGDGPGIANAIKDAGSGNTRHSQWLASQPRV